MPDFAPPATVPVSVASLLPREPSVTASKTAPMAAPATAPLTMLFPVDISFAKALHSSRSDSYWDMSVPFVSIIGFESTASKIEPD
ncbi:uncharacterized protein METZ01_LOCUS233603 [marine metagenome]|uniref:Uncharacterized protein n=1 Tax=marine metagenome TaxID=408172 RepID=A0A382H0M6_9ZZZZ